MSILDLIPAQNLTTPVSKALSMRTMRYTREACVGMQTQKAAGGVIALQDVQFGTQSVGKFKRQGWQELGAECLPDIK